MGNNTHRHTAPTERLTRLVADMDFKWESHFDEGHSNGKADKLSQPTGPSRPPDQHLGHPHPERKTRRHTSAHVETNPSQTGPTGRFSADVCESKTAWSIDEPTAFQAIRTTDAARSSTWRQKSTDNTPRSHL